MTTSSQTSTPLALEVIHDPVVARAALHPDRRRILECLVDDGSAASVARRLGLPRQRVTYHLRQLEKQRLVRPTGKRMAGNCVERLYRVTARGYVIAPQIFGILAVDPGRVDDVFSASYLIAVAARSIEDVARLSAGAARARKRLATFTLETEVRFRDTQQQHAFAEELSRSLLDLVAKYHDDSAERGRRFRFAVCGHPAVPDRR